MALSGLEHFATIHRLLSELVRHYNTESSSQDRSVNECNVKSLMEYVCESTLNIRENIDISLNRSQDSFHLLKLCQDRLSSRYYDPRFSRLLHLYNQLGSSAFSNRFITFLLFLSNQSNGDSSQHSLLSTCYPVPLEPSLSPCISLLSAVLNDTPSPVAPPSPAALSSEGEETSLEAYDLLERQLVSDLIETLQGRGGLHISTCSQLVNGTSRVEVNVSPCIPPSLLRRCTRLLPLACDYSHIELLAEQMSRSPGAVVRSLVAAVRTHMEEYREFVGLYPELERGPRTLRSLLLYVQEPMYCVPRVCSLLDSWQSSGARGGALLNLVYRASFSGCERMRDILCQFLAELMAPLQSLLHGWVCLGEIEREQKDFFIEANQDSSGDIWDEGYCISEANLVDFISQQLVSRILITGKAVSFMRLVCQEPRENFCCAEELFDAFSLSFETVLDGTFENIIYEVYLAQSAHLMRLLEHSFQFRVHLRGFRDFFLMAKGDFWFSFLTKAKQLLSSPAGNIQELNLLFYFALQSTTAKIVPGFVTDRLEVALASDSEGKICWNVLSLNYILTPPLNTVFPTNTIQTYQSIFRVALNIRKNEFILSDIWRRLSLYVRETAEEYALSQLYYTSHLYVGCMMHFVRNVQFYMCHLFTSQWAELSRALEGCADLDKLRSTHLRYLELLRDSCYLVSPQNVIQTDLIKLRYLHMLTDLNSIFLSLLDCIALAEVTFLNMFSELDSEFKARQETEEQIQSADSDWGMTNSSEKKELERMDEFMNKMQLSNEAMRVQYRNFNQTVRTFVVNIYMNPILNLRRVAVNINFNGFYKSNTFT